MTTKSQLEKDVAFLAKRSARAGAFDCDSRRDWGMSSNSIVGMAYGIGRQVMPSDWDDYAACVRAVRRLPRHRRTAAIMAALVRAKAAVVRRYSIARRRSWWRERQAKAA